ncbi:MAG: hypothetical protein FWG82_05730 [Oscillospiraceae bacterium]|nr:hypothetical protein [Oscillospiraceae bacterium]
MSFTRLLTEEEFRRKLAVWMVKNARTAPPEGSVWAEEYIRSYPLPRLEWDLSQHYVAVDGRLHLHFRAELQLLSCQTKDGKAPRSLAVWQVRARMGAEEELLGYFVS